MKASRFLLTKNWSMRRDRARPLRGQTARRIHSNSSFCGPFRHSELPAESVVMRVSCRIPFMRGTRVKATNKRSSTLTFEMCYVARHLGTSKSPGGRSLGANNKKTEREERGCRFVSYKQIDRPPCCRRYQRLLAQGPHLQTTAAPCDVGGRPAVLVTASTKMIILLRVMVFGY